MFFNSGKKHSPIAWISRFLLYFTFAIILILSTFLVILNTNQAKQYLSKLIKSQTGYLVTIQNSLTIFIFNDIYIKAKNIYIETPEKKESFLAQTLSLKISIIQLLKNNIFFDKINIENPKLTLNFTNISRKNNSANKYKKSVWTTEFASNIKIKNASITILADTPNVNFTINNLNFNFDQKNNSSDLRADLSGKIGNTNITSGYIISKSSAQLSVPNNQFSSFHKLNTTIFIQDNILNNSAVITLLGNIEPNKNIDFQKIKGVINNFPFQGSFYLELNQTAYKKLNATLNGTNIIPFLKFVGLKNMYKPLPFSINTNFNGQKNTKISGILGVSDFNFDYTPSLETDSYKINSEILNYQNISPLIQLVAHSNSVSKINKNLTFDLFVHDFFYKNNSLKNINLNFTQNTNKRANLSLHKDNIFWQLNWLSELNSNEISAKLSAKQEDNVLALPIFDATLNRDITNNTWFSITISKRNIFLKNIGLTPMQAKDVLVAWKGNFTPSKDGYQCNINGISGKHKANFSIQSKNNQLTADIDFGMIDLAPYFITIKNFLKDQTQSTETSIFTKNFPSIRNFNLKNLNIENFRINELNLKQNIPTFDYLLEAKLDNGRISVLFLKQSNFSSFDANFTSLNLIPLQGLFGTKIFKQGFLNGFLKIKKISTSPKFSFEHLNLNITADNLISYKYTLPAKIDLIANLTSNSDKNINFYGKSKLTFSKTLNTDISFKGNGKIFPNYTLHSDIEATLNTKNYPSLNINTNLLMNNKLIEFNDLSISTGETKLKANFKINNWQSNPISNGNLETNIFSLRKLSDKYGKFLWYNSEDAFQIFQVKSNIEINKNIVYFTNIAVTSDNTKVNGTLSCDLGNNYFINTNLTANNFNLDKFIGPDDPIYQPKSKTRGANILKKLNFVGIANVDTFTYLNFTANNIKTKWNSQAGLIVGDFKSNDFYSGNTSAKLTFDGRGSSIFSTYKMNIKNTKLGKALKDALGKDYMTGTLTALIDFKFSFTQDLVAPTLNGKISAQTNKGIIRGFSISKKSTQQNLSDNDKWEPYFTARANCSVVNGIFYNKDLKVTGNSYSLTGAGNINLNNKSVDYNGLAILNILGFPDIPFQATGHFNKIEVNIPKGQLAQKIGTGILSIPTSVGKGAINAINYLFGDSQKNKTTNSESTINHETPSSNH